MKRAGVLSLALACCLLLLGAAAGPELPAQEQRELQAMQRRAQETLAEPHYGSEAPAKLDWSVAYASFYSGRAHLGREASFFVTSEQASVREDSIYPMFAGGYGESRSAFDSAFATMRLGACDVKDFLALPWSVFEYGALLDRASSPADGGSLCGEAGFSYQPGEAGLTPGWYDRWLRWFPAQTRRGLRSLVVTEGLENQLLAMGFSPKTTTAFAAQLFNAGGGICFVDGDRLAWYPTSISLVSPWDLGCLYTSAELGLANRVAIEWGKTAENPLT